MKLQLFKSPKEYYEEHCLKKRNENAQKEIFWKETQKYFETSGRNLKYFESLILKHPFSSSSFPTPKLMKENLEERRQELKELLLSEERKWKTRLSTLQNTKEKIHLFVESRQREKDRETNEYKELDILLNEPTYQHSSTHHKKELKIHTSWETKRKENLKIESFSEKNDPETTTSMEFKSSEIDQKEKRLESPMNEFNLRENWEKELMSLRNEYNKRQEREKNLQCQLGIQRENEESINQLEERLKGVRISFETLNHSRCSKKTISQRLQDAHFQILASMESEEKILKGFYFDSEKSEEENSESMKRLKELIEEERSQRVKLQLNTHGRCFLFEEEAQALWNKEKDRWKKQETTRVLIKEEMLQKQKLVLRHQRQDMEEKLKEVSREKNEILKEIERLKFHFEEKEEKAFENTLSPCSNETNHNNNQKEEEEEKMKGENHSLKTTESEFLQLNLEAQKTDRDLNDFKRRRAKWW